MFGPNSKTSLSAEEYAVLVRMLARETGRLKAEADKQRDAFDPMAWARATAQWRLASSLRWRLETEMEALPPTTDEQRGWEESRLRRLAETVPRSNANAVAHHAAMVERRKVQEARRKKRRLGT